MCVLVPGGEETEEEADEETAGGSQYHKLMMPELIVSLDADDEFLRQRVMNLPEIVVVGTHLTEDGLMRRLADYRAINNDDDTVLNYFDELEFHPQHIGQSALQLMSNQFSVLIIVQRMTMKVWCSSRIGTC